MAGLDVGFTGAVCRFKSTRCPPSRKLAILPDRRKTQMLTLLPTKLKYWNGFGMFPLMTA